MLENQKQKLPLEWFNNLEILILIHLRKRLHQLIANLAINFSKIVILFLMHWIITARKYVDSLAFKYNLPLFVLQWE